MHWKYRVLWTSLIAIMLFVISNGVVLARASLEFNNTTGKSEHTFSSIENPIEDYADHNINKMHITMSNKGIIGASLLNGSPLCDGTSCPNCIYPINSDREYLFGGCFWIGAIVGTDTLVSGAADGWYGGPNEIFPPRGDSGLIKIRSTIPSSLDYSEDAVSEQDFVVFLADTIDDPSLTGQDTFDARDHIPLNIAIDQVSYAWSYDYAEDFIIMDFKFTNIGDYKIKDLYMAVYVDADVYHNSNSASGYTDDICGFRRLVEIDDPCREYDTINIAYIADNDGDPTNHAWDGNSVPAVTGIRVLRTPNEDLSYAFNWWISNSNVNDDFGPRLAATQEDPFYPFPLGNLGTPTGDKVKYYVMSHSEFDYDQLYTGISHVDEGYLPPPESNDAQNYADGYDTRYLLSFGPFDVEIGDTLPITLAYVAGDTFHVNPDDFEDYFDYRYPDIFYDKLSFRDLGTNCRWADWIFDNPGVDTDGDGDSGRYWWVAELRDDTLCYEEGDLPEGLPDSVMDVVKKVYYKGDFSGGKGAPDFSGATPPPVPVLSLTPSFGEIIIRWNGQKSENTPDPFSGIRDFEGYKVYMAQGDSTQVTDNDFILLTTFDVDDYSRIVFNGDNWVVTETPFSLDSLRTLFNDPEFDPNIYNSEYSAFTDTSTGNIMYFEPQDYNQSDLLDPNGIHRVYPNASRTDPSDTTTEGYLRYYEYEYVISNLQPSVPWTFSVTTFDFGSIGGTTELNSMESAKLLNAVSEYPLPGSDVVEEDGLEVMVWPNPYRIDGDYAAKGYENRTRDKSAERSRRVHFGNLPTICTIRIFSIDGDLVKEIYHNRPDGGPGSQEEEWDVISRNTQAVVTGIYLWHVESDMGEQLGKLVIIM